jgi:hypothetical protein
MSWSFREATAVIALAYMMMAGCTSSASTPRLLIYGTSQGVGQVELKGELTIRDNCVGLTNDAGFTGLIWPDGTSVSSTDGGWAVLMPDGEASAEIDQLVALGGESVGGGGAEGLVDGDIPQGCLVGRFFKVGEIA